MKAALMNYGRTLVAVACGLTVVPPVQAGTQHVTLTTGALSGRGTYYVEFTLTDGSGLSDGNSRVSVSHFLLSGGAMGSVLPPTSGGVTGGLAGTLALADTSVVNDFAQGFTVTNPSSLMSFDLTFTNTGVDAGTPDEFSLQLLDGNQNALSTNGPTGTEFVRSDFTTTSPSATGFTSTGAGFTPPITAAISAAPEPGTPSGLALGALGVCGLLRSRRRTRGVRAARLVPGPSRT